nr:uncharacterized protein LOC127348800 [Lolium perenne]
MFFVRRSPGRIELGMTVIVPDYVLEEGSLEAFIARARLYLDTVAGRLLGGGFFSGLDPASSEAIAGLHVPAAGETREQDCAVCLEDFDEDGGDAELRTMRCSHSFHQRCIFRWLRVSRVCPCCRFSLSSAYDQLFLADQQPASDGARLLDLEPSDD